MDFLHHFHLFDVKNPLSELVVYNENNNKESYVGKNLPKSPLMAVNGEL